MMYPEIAGRPWQQDGLQAWSAMLGTGRQVFFTQACPGAGKTRFAIAAIKFAMEKEDVEMVIVVAPTETLRRQWRDEGLRYGITLHHWSSDALRDSMISDTIPTGIVTTYAQATTPNVRDAFEHWTRSRRVLIVLDEIHHCGDQRSWGRAVEIAFQNATRVMVLSGTPFRSDDQGMPFIMEPHPDNAGAMQVRPADASHSYRDAIEAQTCRMVAFPKINATIQLEDDNGVWSGILNDLTLEPSQRAKLYRGALDPNACGFSRHFLDLAWGELQRIRTEEQEDAAMLVIAATQAHAHVLAEELHAITKRRVPKVMSDVPNSKTIIEHFRDSKEPILVSVAMVAEGVDVPRVRVVAFLSRIKTEMWFRQIVGRAVRMQTGLGIDRLQWAQVFIPNMPEFTDMARDIEEDVKYVIAEQGRMIAPRANRETNGGGVAPIFIVHGSEDEARNGFIAMGEDMDAEDEEAAIGVKAQDSRLARFPVESVALIRRLLAKDVTPAERRHFAELDA